MDGVGILWLRQSSSYATGERNRFSFIAGPIPASVNRMDVPPEIWLVDDDADLRMLFRAALKGNGFHLEECANGAAALALLETRKPDLVILDVDMPEMNGFQVLAAMRSQGHTFAIMMVTGMNDMESRIRGLDEGADGYVGKPCGTAELLARVRALMRRFPALNPKGPKGMQVGDLDIDFASLTARKGGEQLHLTRTDYKLLELLSNNSGRVVTRESIMEHVWGSPNGGSHVLDTHMWRLRSKLGDRGEGPKIIENVPGVGFRVSV